MRKDIIVEKILKKGDIGVINKSELAKRYNCCWRTIDRRINPEKYKRDKKPRIYTSKLDEYKHIIDAKLALENVPATGIYFLLKTKYSFNGKYGIVSKYVRSKKQSIIKEITTRFETIPGYQAQVDWKENLTLHNEKGKTYVINIFLIVLGYSRLKYIELTFDKEQKTLCNCITNALEYFGGTPDEMLFDNMKTVVDQAKNNFNELIINQTMEAYSKDAGFKIIACRAYRPRTKGKVETLAKIMNRLRAFDYEFSNIEELNDVVNKLLKELNEVEKSQAINEIPVKKFEKEKEHLTPVNLDLLRNFMVALKTYKVTNESMISYKGIKYSVPIKYIGKAMTVSEDFGYIHIYYTTELVCSYSKSDVFKYNYKKTDYIDILKNSAFDNKTNEEIENYINNNLNSLDGINIEE
ncbi:MAG: IS21 family transposase [Bacilli bacterium]|nr:IS21 family transposase [Bacilli bacterium]